MEECNCPFYLVGSKGRFCSKVQISTDRIKSKFFRFLCMIPSKFYDQFSKKKKERFCDQHCNPCLQHKLTIYVCIYRIEHNVIIKCIKYQFNIINYFSRLLFKEDGSYVVFCTVETKNIYHSSFGLKQVI